LQTFALIPKRTPIWTSRAMEKVTDEEYLAGFANN
jgi:hypothetical protein